MSGITEQRYTLPSLAELTRAPSTTIEWLPRVVNLALMQGDDFWLDIVLADADGMPVDLTGVTAMAQIRSAPTNETVMAEFDATTEADTVHLHLTHAESSKLSLANSVWDCQIESNGIVLTVCAGTVATRAEVTR